MKDGYEVVFGVTLLCLLGFVFFNLQERAYEGHHAAVSTTIPLRPVSGHWRPSLSSTAADICPAYGYHTGTTFLEANCPGFDLEYVLNDGQPLLRMKELDTLLVGKSLLVLGDSLALYLGKSLFCQCNRELNNSHFTNAQAVTLELPSKGKITMTQLQTFEIMQQQGVSFADLINGYDIVVAQFGAWYMRNGITFRDALERHAPTMYNHHIKPGKAFVLLSQWAPHFATLSGEFQDGARCQMNDCNAPNIDHLCGGDITSLTQRGFGSMARQRGPDHYIGL